VDWADKLLKGVEVGAHGAQAVRLVDKKAGDSGEGRDDRCDLLVGEAIALDVFEVESCVIVEALEDLLQGLVAGVVLGDEGSGFVRVLERVTTFRVT
jgi:hypothetical protein